MKCKKCGTTLLHGNKFCENCGEPVEESFLANSMNLQGSFKGKTRRDDGKNSKRKLSKILAVVGGAGIVAGLFLMMITFFTKDSKELICKSEKGNITIRYNTNGIISYKASDMSYDLNGQKKYAKQVGMDAYVSEFNTWFVTNTAGTCTIDGKNVSDNKNDVDTTTHFNGMVVGDENYGYITVPSNWIRFYDVDGNTSLQYSYANVYIVSLNSLQDHQHSAKDLASNFMYNMQNSTDVTGVTGATVTIGKNKEYTAYQVYMYYPADSIYLITYWFEAEDGKIHYIALEGPAELSDTKLTDYLSIPESFSLKK